MSRTYDRARREYYWPRQYADVQSYVQKCVDCTTGRGAPPDPGRSPGNIVPEHPFHVVSMDFVIPLPESDRGNTALLLFQCMFSGFVMCKAMARTQAQDVAEAYEEVVFRRFGVSSIIRSDRDPRFMSEVFRCFREMMGSRQRATLAYRPQANGQQERSVQTMVRSIKAYVEDPAQRDWDDLAEKLTWAVNTSFDNTRKETPFFLVHGWDAKNTMSAMLKAVPPGGELRSPYLWRLKIQREYEYVMAWARSLQEEAKVRRAEAANQTRQERFSDDPPEYRVGEAVWMYLPLTKPGLSRKLAHLWHGPFRIVESDGATRVKLKLAGTSYKFYPWVHVSRVKHRRFCPDRPAEPPEAEVDEDDDFDAALLPEDSWEPDEEAGDYEVVKIHDVRWVQRTRSSKRTKEYLVEWKGYRDKDWMPAGRLNCGRLLYEFDQTAKARNRFRAMQTADEE